MKLSYQIFLFFLLSLLYLYADKLKSDQKLQEAWNFWNENNQTVVEQLLLDAVQEDKNNVRAYLALSYLYQLQYKYAQAWEQYQKIFSLEKNYYPYIHAAILTPKFILNIDKKNSQLTSFLEQTLNDKNSDGFIRAIIHERLGNYYQEHNQLVKARKHFDAVGAIINWTLIGPFDNISASGYDNVFPPEWEYQENKEYEGKNGIPVKWFPLKAVRFDHWTDLQRYFPYNQSIFFGNTFIYSSEKQTIHFRVGTSGSLKAYLNDELMITCFDENNNGIDTYIVETELQKGWNRILIKCGYSEINQCNFLVRITDVRGFPISNVQVATGAQPYQSKPEATCKSIPIATEAFFQEKIAEHPDYLENYLLLSDCYLQNDKAVEAELILQQAIKRAANNALLYQHILEAYLRGEKYDEYYTTIEKTYLLDKHIPYILENKFNQYINNRDSEKAEELFNQLMLLLPDFPDIYQYQLQLYAQKSLDEKIFKTSQEAYKKYPDDWKTVEMEARLSILRTKSYDRSIKIIKSFLDKNTTRDAFITLADYYLQSSKLKKWEEVYQKAIDFYPASTGYFYHMADIYLSIQDYKKAEKYIEQSIRICPGSSLYWAKLGEIKRATNQIKEAKDAYRMALTYNPSDYETRDILRELEGKKSIFTLFQSVTIDSMIKNSPSADHYPGDGALILLNNVKRVVYDKGTSESNQEILIKVFNDQGIDDFKEYVLDYNHNTEELIVDKAITIKTDRSEINADINDNQIVFKSLNKDDYIYIKWRIRNYYSGKLSNHFWDEFYFSSIYPVKNIRYTILVPKNFPFHYQTQHMPEQPVMKTETDDGIIYQWSLTDEPAVKYEYNMPLLEDIGKKLFISSIDSWEYLVNWYLDLARTKTRTSYEIKELIKKLFENQEDLSEIEKIHVIYQYINENIRYSYVSFRQSAHIPQKARDVLVHRIGDCKDMATLCIALLREVGIEAHYVLLNTKNEGLNRHILPSIAFNHVIVAVPVADSILYLDLTAENYPVGAVPEMDKDAFALYIKKGTKDPFYLAAENFKKSSIIRNNTVEIKSDNSIFCKIKSKRTYNLAAGFRSVYRFHNQEDRMKKLTEVLSKEYPNINLLSLNMENMEGIEPELYYDYEFSVPSYVSDLAGFKIIKLPWADKLEANKALAYDSRKYSYDYWPTVDTLSEEIKVRLPAGYIPAELNRKTVFHCPIAEYTLYLDYKNGIISGKRVLINKKSVVKPDEYLEFKEFYNNVIKTDDQQILLKKK
jgi:cytochrome c-type biogenesis protein CcmH/NrfG